MQDKIMCSVAISNRHVHLTNEDYNKLFDEPMEKKRDLNQLGEYACIETVTLKGPNGVIEHVRVIGPNRSYTQVEVSKSDALVLGVNPPVRASGEINASAPITIIGPKGEINLETGCILAQRHVHMNEEKAYELGLKNQDNVEILVHNDKGGRMNAKVKVTKNGYFEIHLDKDDANAFLLSTGDVVEIKK